MKIAQVLNADSWGEIGPDALKRGIGGREGALIRLSKEWAKLGHEITNFVPTTVANRFHESSVPFARATFGPPDATPELFKIPGFHEYIPLSLAKPALSSFPYDAVVAWECPSVYDSEHVLEKQRVRLVHMQVAHLQDKEQEAANQFATGVVALSEWAKEFLVHSGLTLSGDRLFVRPNGVDIDSYPLKQALNKPNGYSFVYSSSPDRGLVHILEAWPYILSHYPKAKLLVAYGVEKYVEQLKWAHSRIGEMCVKIIDGMKQTGVIDIGKIGQDRLAELQMNACAWLYPADTIQATETGCITAIENMAACNICIMSDVDCLKSEFSRVAEIAPLPFNAKAYADKVYETLESERDKQQWIVEHGRKFAESRDWSLIAPTWIDLFKESAIKEAANG